jgi:phage-related protein (TIGR01555 family)
VSNRRKPSNLVPEPAKASKRPSYGAASMLAATLAQPENAEFRRQIKAPALPPGVVPAKPPAEYVALDSAANNALYGWMNGQPGFCGLGFPGYTYLAELSQRSEYRAPAETMAKEMTRAWFKFTGADEEKLKELSDAFEEFGVQQHFRQLAATDGFFGRAQLYIQIKGQESDVRRALPLLYEPETIKKGSLLGFKPIEPIWTTPYMYNSNDPTRADFYKPEAWYVMGKKTHASRLLTFVSRPVPDILKPAYNFSGMSLSQLIEPYVVRWLKTVDSVNRLVSNFSVSGIATNLQATLADDSSGNELMKRAQLFNQLRDNRGMMMLDKDTEEFFQFNTPLSGLSELQAQAQEHMAAPTHIPLVKLTGATPDGLNASSEGEIKVFYDHVASEQESVFDAHLTTVLKVVQLHLWGEIDEDIKFEWVPLDSPTDKELSEMRKADADAGTGYINAGVITGDEERERLRNDPNSGYTFITGPAPTPPQEVDHALGEESADNAHERSEESADNAAQREAKLNKGKKD